MGLLKPDAGTFVIYYEIGKSRQRHEERGEREKPT
jgi:hypothetical protein